MSYVNFWEEINNFSICKLENSKQELLRHIKIINFLISKKIKQEELTNDECSRLTDFESEVRRGI